MLKVSDFLVHNKNYRIMFKFKKLKLNLMEISIQVLRGKIRQ